MVLLEVNCNASIGSEKHRNEVNFNLKGSHKNTNCTIKVIL